jgi:hypothetical protein
MSCLFSSFVRDRVGELQRELEVEFDPVTEIVGSRVGELQEVKEIVGIEV